MLVSPWIRIHVKQIDKQQFRRLGLPVTRIEMKACLLELLQLEGTFPQCRWTQHVHIVGLGIEYEQGFGVNPVRSNVRCSGTGLETWQRRLTQVELYPVYVMELLVGAVNTTHERYSS